MIAAAALLLLAGAPAALPLLDVRTLDASITARDGQEVRVRGWLGRCERFGCTLYSDRAGEVAMANWSQSWRARPRPARPPAVRLGGDGVFDRRAAALAGRHVVVTGRVSSACRIGICTDRAPDLLPVSIDAWPARPRR